MGRNRSLTEITDIFVDIFNIIAENDDKLEDYRNKKDLDGYVRYTLVAQERYKKKHARYIEFIRAYIGILEVNDTKYSADASPSGPALEQPCIDIIQNAIFQNIVDKAKGVIAEFNKINQYIYNLQ